MNDEDIYRRQTFGTATGYGTSPALLVVDFVNGFVDPEILGGGNIAEAGGWGGPDRRGFRRTNGLRSIPTQV